MARSRRQLSGAGLVLLGVVMGWLMGRLPATTVKASGGDRAGESILASGPVMITYSDSRRVPIAQDALYYLDYKAGRLFATVPSFRSSLSGPSKLIDAFAERDLVADFKIDVANGVRPRFLMTTGSLGAYSEGWAPLYVFESTTNQVGVYKVQMQTIGINSTPRFELVELRPIVSAAPAVLPR